MNLKEQLQEDIITYFEKDGLYPPFIYTQMMKEIMVNELCGIIVERISEAQYNG